MPTREQIVRAIDREGDTESAIVAIAGRGGMEWPTRERIIDAFEETIAAAPGRVARREDIATAILSLFEPFRAELEAIGQMYGWQPGFGWDSLSDLVRDSRRQAQACSDAEHGLNGALLREAAILRPIASAAVAWVSCADSDDDWEEAYNTLSALADSLTPDQSAALLEGK